jgi:putative phosphoribosyl transferase
MSSRALFAPGSPAFRDRRDAGRRLAEHLRAFAEERPIVVGLPRGGVPVAYEVARALAAPLDVLIVRKIGHPMQPELGLGALGEDGTLLLDKAGLQALGIHEDDLKPLVEREQRELGRRRALYRGTREALEVGGRTVLLVDDGVATGGTARAAARILVARGAAKVVLAVPVGPPGVEDRFAGEVDEVVCLEQPASFFAVGQAYEVFGQTTDEEVTRVLAAAADEDALASAATEPADLCDPPARSGGVAWDAIERRAVEISADGRRLAGDLRIPAHALGLVVFAHGSGSSRVSPRNVQVASALNGHRFATLLFDLLEEGEAVDRGRVFDVELLARRLLAATRWAAAEGSLNHLPLGYFGASTGAAAALAAAASSPEGIRAVVSRGGRPDLAAPWLSKVTAPTLLIVGGRDEIVLELNQGAARALAAPHEIAIVPGATHLFEEPGALACVTDLAAGWFAQHLVTVRTTTRG